MYIPYNVNELQALLDKSAFDFAILIEEKKWLNFIYTGDCEHNARLQFVRMWYYSKWRKKQGVNEKTKVDKKGQFKLL